VSRVEIRTHDGSDYVVPEAGTPRGERPTAGAPRSRGDPVDLSSAIRILGVRGALASPTWYTAIVDLHKEQYCHENPLFWTACEFWRRIESPDERREKARVIFDAYFRPNAPLELNIQKKTRDTVAAAATADFPDVSDALFKRAQHEVLFLITGNINSALAEQTSASSTTIRRGRAGSTRSSGSSSKGYTLCDRCGHDIAVMRAAHRGRDNVELICLTCKQGDPVMRRLPTPPGALAAANKARAAIEESKAALSSPLAIPDMTRSPSLEKASSDPARYESDMSDILVKGANVSRILADSDSE
jgi:hypothetical protein